jgi:hypothetical protein
MLITHITCPRGDWEAYYLDDKLIDQGHRVATGRLLEHLVQESAGVFELHVHSITDDRMEALGFLPNKLADLDD